MNAADRAKRLAVAIDTYGESHATRALTWPAVVDGAGAHRTVTWIDNPNGDPTIRYSAHQYRRSHRHQMDSSGGMATRMSIGEIEPIVEWPGSRWRPKHVERALFEHVWRAAKARAGDAHNLHNVAAFAGGYREPPMRTDTDLSATSDTELVRLYLLGKDAEDEMERRAGYDKAVALLDRGVLVEGEAACKVADERAIELGYGDGTVRSVLPISTTWPMVLRRMAARAAEKL